MSFHSFAQVSLQQPAADTVREFEIIRAPSMRAIKIDSTTTLQTLAGGGVVVKQGTTIFHCDSAVINPTTHILEAFGNIEINQADTVHTYGQYLKYLGVEKIAHIEKDVKLSNKSATLFTQTLDYNLNTGIGNFINGGKVIEGKNVITSLEGTYYDDTKDVYFKKNVKLDGPKNHVRADSLLYNMQTKKSTFISRTYIKNPDVEINTTEGNYDLNTGNALFTSRTTVKDSSNRIYTANSMALEDKTGNAQLEGNAVIIDSAGGYTILANQVFLNKKNNSFLATRKPVLILKQKRDSTYIGADTIFSGYTSFVNNQNKVLQKDTVINVNLKENEKVRQTLLHDSTKIPTNIDSIIKAHPVNESFRGRKPKVLKDNEGKIRNEGDSVFIKDSLKKETANIIHNKDSVLQKNLLEKEIIEKNIHPDSTHLKDSLKNEIVEMNLKKDSLQKHDSAKNEILAKKQPVDSLPIDSLSKNENIKITDSSFTDLKLKKDSTNKSDTAIRYFLAFHHVKIYNDSLQSVCDSLFISSQDSVFRLYYDPVVWSGNTQITGDTIFMYTQNKQPKRLYVFENGLIVNQTKEGFFNQMAGKTINGYFIDGKIDYMRVKGTQAESIYYIQDDDSAYIGMNRATGDVIDMYFKNEDLKRVLFINDIKGNMYPMTQIPEEERKLKFFKWLDNKRPKNKAVIFE